MSVTIENTPAEISLAGNPARYEVSSDNAVSTAGVKAQFTREVTDTDTTAGHRFSIAWGDKDLTFILVNTLTDDPCDVQVGTPGESAYQFAMKIYNALISNYDIVKDFSVTVPVDTPGMVYIGLQARREGSDFTITFDAGDFTIFDTGFDVTGVDPVYRENFGIVMTLWNQYKTEILGEDFKSMTDETSLYFDISEYLLSQLLSDDHEKFEFPEPTGGAISNERTYSVLPYWISFAEKYSDAVKKLVFDSLVRYAIPGGLNRETLNYYNEQEDNFFTYGSNQKFLTWCPTTKRTTHTTIEKLYLLADFDDASIYDLYCKVYYSDGTNYTFDQTLPEIIQTVTFLELMVGYEILGLGALNPSKTVVAWEVWVEKIGVARSEVRRFEIDERYYENERVFLFRNSFGAYETVRMTGAREDNLEFDRLIAVQEMDVLETSRSAPVRNYAVNEQQAFKVNSGWISREEKDWLRDLLISTEIYEIVGTQLVPVVIDSKKAFLFKDKETNYSLEFEYNRAFTDRYYSRIENQSIPEPGQSGHTIITEDRTVDSSSELYILRATNEGMVIDLDLIAGLATNIQFVNQSYPVTIKSSEDLLIDGYSSIILNMMQAVSILPAEDHFEVTSGNYEIPT